MIPTYKVLSLLLSYPTPELQEAATDLAKALDDDAMLTKGQRQGLAPLFEELVDDDIFDVQERYVTLFDRTRSLSLNIFEHVHGESRDRGQAMVDLLATYEQHGLTLGASELPDHLPLFLEFLATLEPSEARNYLGEAEHVIAAMQVRLEKRESPYAPVFAALCSVAGGDQDIAAVAELLAAEDDDPNNLEALDEAWQEIAVTFGPDPNAGCPAVRETLAHMTPPTRPGEPG